MKQQAIMKMDGIDMVGVRRTNSSPEQKCYSFYYNQNEGIVSPGRMPQEACRPISPPSSDHYTLNPSPYDCAPWAHIDPTPSSPRGTYLSHDSDLYDHDHGPNHHQNYLRPAHIDQCPPDYDCDPASRAHRDTKSF